MRNSHSRHAQMSLFGAHLCDADSFTPLIKPSDKGLVVDRCPGNYINMVDCHCEDIHLFINEVHGLNFENKTIQGLSPLIDNIGPVIPREWFNRDPSTITHEIVGLRIGDIITPQPRKNSAGILTTSDNIRIDLSALKSPVFQGKKVVLFATGVDVVIEKLWYRRFAINLFEAIASGGFYAVTGMNFSLFLYECPLGHLINLNKSLIFCEELSKLGVPIIPHIYAITDTHREMWVNWLKRHPNIQTVLINTQMQRDRISMYEVELTVKALLKSTAVSIILNGRGLVNPPHDISHRIIVTNQADLKKKAIIENSIISKQLKEMETISGLLAHHEKLPNGLAQLQLNQQFSYF